MFGHKKLLLIVAWLGLTSTLVLAASSAVPALDRDDVRLLVSSDSAAPISPALQSTGETDQTPLLPKTSSTAVPVSLSLPLVASQPKRIQAAVREIALSRTLQSQRVRWQI